MNKELTASAKSFVEELTWHNVVKEGLKSDVAFSKEHVDNNAAVRKMLKKRGVKTDSLTEG